ncbi:MAG: hypothetical protein LBF88_02655 [Planctomycetaceae bacterium]|jgi:hypothetical protein|nr:hypothetical protein [Planctomycetaceae bacterium]
MKKVFGITLVLWGTMSLVSIPMQGGLSLFSLADNCNYDVVEADPNPCTLDILTQRCSATNPCADGFTTAPSMNTSCGTSSVMGTDAVLKQPNPNGGNKKSIVVPDLECGIWVPCVTNQTFRGHCVNGTPTADDSFSTYVADCCDGAVTPSTSRIYVNQAGAEDCGG